MGESMRMCISISFLQRPYLSRANTQFFHGDIFFQRAGDLYITRLANVALATFLRPADLNRCAAYTYMII